MAQVFISYSRKDKDFVRKIGDSLAAQKREAWVDWKDIPLTAEWQQEIFTNIEAADNFIFVISPESAASANCRKEIDHAMANNKRMVPIFYRPVPDEAIPEALGKFQRIDFGDNDDFDSKFAALIAALDADLAWVQMHTRLLTRAKEWEREAKDSSFLLRGKDLREAEQWVAKSAEKEPAPTTLHSQYILASRRAATKLQRIIIAAVAVAFVVAVILAVYAFRQKNLAQRETKEAEHQRNVANANATEAQKQKRVAEEQTAVATEQKRVAVSRQLAAQALSQMAVRIDLALLLAIEASRPAKTVDANNSLLKILQSAPGLVTLLHGHSGRVSQVAFSPDGTVIASGAADSTVRLWNAQTGETLTTGPLYRHTSEVSSGDEVRTLAFSPDGSMVASGSFSGTLLWGDLRQRKAGIESKFGGTVSALAFAPDGRVVGGSNGLYLLDLRASKQIGPEFAVDNVGGFMPTAVAVSPDGKLVAATKMTYPDEGLYLFDASTRQSMGNRITEKFPLIEILRFSPDSKMLAAGSTDGSVRIWDVAERRLLGPALTCDGKVLAMDFHAGGERLAWACAGGSVRVWNVERWGAAQEPVFVGAAESAAFSPDRSTIALGSADGAVRIWDLGENHHPLGRSIATSQWLEAAAIAPDGKYAVIGGDSVGMWDLASAKELHALKGYKPFWMAFSKDGRKFVSAGEYGVGLYEMPSGTLFSLPSTEKEPYNWSVAITPDGGKLAFGGKGLTVWDVARKSPLPSPLPDKKSVYAVAISPDGSTLAAGGEDKLVRTWNLATGKSIGDAFPFGQEIWSLAFSPDGRILAAGGNEGKLQLWDMKTRLPLGGQIPGHTSRIRSIAFSPDGLLMVAAGFRRKAVIYDVATHQPLGDPLFSDSEYETIATAAFSPDGQTLLLVDRRQQFFLLAGGPAAWSARACKVANRNLTADEWTRYIGDQPYERTCPGLPGPSGK